MRRGLRIWNGLLASEPPTQPSPTRGEGKTSTNLFKRCQGKAPTPSPLVGEGWGGGSTAHWPLAFLIVFISLCPARGQVSPSAGTTRVRDAAALKTALERARPGDSIALADGPWTDTEIDFHAEGSPDAPITLRAETPGRVVLGGGSKLRIGGRHLIVSGLRFEGPTTLRSGSVVEFRRDSKRLAEHCRLTDCAFVNVNPADKKTDTKWVSLYGQDNRVDRCFFEGKTNVGTTLVVWVADRPNGHRIDYNHFGPRPRLGGNGGESIRIGTSDVSMNVSRTTVEANLFEGCDGEGEIVSNKSCENVYRGNTFVECAGALTLRHGNRCIVEGNIFLGRGKRETGGVRVIGEGHRVVNNAFVDLIGSGAKSALTVMNGVPDSPLNEYFRVKDATIAFNTFAGCRHPIVLGLGDKKATLPPVRCTIANNLIEGRSGPLVEVLAQPVDLRWRGNLFHGAEVGLSPVPDGIADRDPRLVIADDGLPRPGPDSPAIGAAVGDDPEVRIDIDGQPRDGAGGKDVGCDQRSTAPIARRPLRPEDVGPSWRHATGRDSDRRS